METCVKLLEKRREIKEAIDKGIHETPMASLFNATGKAVQKITRYPRPLPWGYSAAVLALLLPLLTLLTTLFCREAEIVLQIGLFPLITASIGFLLSVILAYRNVNNVLLVIRNALVDSIESLQDLSSLQLWLSSGWSLKRKRYFLFLWTLVLGSASTLYVSIQLNSFPGFGLLIFVLIAAILSEIAVYYVPLMILLPIRLRHYQYALYDNNPAHSEIISTISDMLNRYSYVFVLITVIVQLCLATIDIIVWFGVLVMIIIGWIPLTIQFVINQTSLAHIITAAKWKTLERIQAQIKVLHNGDFTDKDNLETINHLMDYHERIYATPDSTLDLKASLSFINQLTLPLLGFLLGNIEKVLDFFGMAP